VARFLDLLGSRWTLLIVRDLLARPRRFKELLASAPSMGPNLLTVRLRDLGHEGIVKKVSPTNEAEHYELTKKGHGLEPVIHEIVRWSLKHIEVDPDSPGVSRPDLLVVALRALFDPDRAPDVTENYEFRVDDVVFHLNMSKGKLETEFGRCPDAAFTLETSAAVLDQLGTGIIDIETALERGLATVVGDEAAFERFATTFSQV